MSDYSDYVFIVHGKLVTHYQVIDPGECFKFYKFDSPSIYAIKKSDFDETKIEAWRYFPDKNIESEPTAIRSNITLESYDTVAGTDPLEKVVTVLKIVSLSETGFEIKKSKIIYSYIDGSSEEKIFQKQD